MFYKNLLATAIIAGVAGWANAADVVISATRIPTSIEDQNAQVIVLDKADIEALAANNVSEVLNSIAAIDASGSNGDSIGIRGFNDQSTSSNVLIILNGRRLNNADISTTEINQIPVELIDRIEVLTGNIGVMYGDQAVAAVITIETRDPEQGHITLSSDQNSSLELFYANRFNDNLGYHLNLDQFKSPRENDDSNLYSLGLNSKKATGYGSQSWFVDLISEYEQLPGDLSLAQLNADPNQSSDTDYYENREASIGFSQHRQLSTAEFLAEAVVRGSDSKIEYSSGPSYSQNRSIEFTPRFKGQAGNDFTWTSGIDLQLSTLDLTNQAFFIDRDNVQTRVGIYGRVTQQWGKLIVAAGTRSETVQDELTDASKFPTGETLTNSANAAEMSFSLQLSDTTTATFEAGQAFRFAKVDEQTFTDPAITGLDPQSGNQLSVSLQSNAEKSSYMLSVYVINTNNEIVYDSSADGPFGPGSGANINSDPRQRAGLSLNSRYNIGTNQSLSAGLEFLQAEFTNGVNEGNEIPWTSPVTASFGFSQKIDQIISWNLNAKYYSDRFPSDDFANTQTKIPATAEVNTSLSFTRENWKTTLAADNILDDQLYNAAYYSDFSGNVGYYPGQPRTISLSLSYKGL